VIQDCTHDRRGAVLTASEEVGISTYDSTYGYGPDGSLTSVIYPSGRKLILTPDFAGRPTNITSTPPGGGSAVTVLADAEYLPSGPAEQLELGPAAGRVTETLGYDWQYRRTGQADVGPGSTSLIDLSYGYDDAGNLTSVTDALGSRGATYGYDDLGRLTGVTWPDGSRAFQYDAIGNVTSLLVDSGLPGEGELTYSYGLNSAGNNDPNLTGLAATQGGSPLWSALVAADDVGNVTSDDASTYTYDLRNHLGSRQVGAASSQHWFTADGRLARFDTGTVTDVVLDPSGRRMARVEAGVWRDYVYLGERLIAYFDTETADPVIVISNHIGMPMAAVDGTGEVVWEAKAEPYGQLRGSVNKASDPGLRYPGQWQDELDLDATCVGDDCTLPGPLDQSFSLFENGYRWYRPDWGRYTQADPTGVLRLGGGTRHLTAYGDWNPLFYIDPLGLDAITDDPGILKCFFCMLKKRGWGRNPFELGAWIIDLSKTGGKGYGCHTEGWKTRFRKAVWSRPTAPLGMVGIAHTHPTRTLSAYHSKPEPSSGDRETADKYSFPVYTISVEGIYKYDPATGAVTREMGPGWDDPIKKCKPDCKEILK